MGGGGRFGRLFAMRPRQDQNVLTTWTRIALIIAVASFGAVFTLPETLALKLLRIKAQKLNKAMGETHYVAAGDLNRGSLLSTLVSSSSSSAVLGRRLTLSRR